VSVLVLASASAVRAQLLASAGIEAEIDPAAIDEAPLKRECREIGRDAGECALLVAEAKAKTVADRHRGALILGADQILECEERWFDKPSSLAEARTQLAELNGRQHRLVTAATILRDGKSLWRAVERPVVTMRRFSDAFLERYLAAMGERVLKSVGAYELEGFGLQLMQRVEGDYFAVLGLPLLPLLAFLRTIGALPT